MDIKTQRLVLRQLCPDDAGWITEEIAKPEVHQWLTSVPCPFQRAHAREFIASFAAEPGARIIVENGRRIGLVSVKPTSQSAGENVTSPELGYWLVQSAWARGIMTEASSALIDWYFQNFDQSVGSGWVEGNARSEQVLSKLGFIPTGETRPEPSPFKGADVPVVRAELTKAAWAARHHP